MSQGWKMLFSLMVIITFGVVQSQNLDFITKDGEAVSEATKMFPTTVYQATNEALQSGSEVKGNFIISPFSIGSVLGMLREGANGSTKTELNEAMQFQSLSDDTISNGYHDILYSLHENKDSVVRIANRIYVTNSATLNPEFTEILQTKYFTKVLPSNFLKNMEVADDINRWVEETTNGKITNLISSSSIDSNTKTIVANAIYFKGKWVKEFSTRGTGEQYFYADDGTNTTAMFMEQEDSFLHAELPELNASAIAMAYEGNRFQLITLLPNEGVKLAEMEEKLKKFNSLTEIPARMSRKSVQLVYPKFKMETEVDFTKSGILRQLGLNDALTPAKADFSLISTEESIHIDTVIQKCFVDITEHGTEAAGATFAKIVPFSIRRSIPFKVTKPFMAYIFDGVTNTVLFSLRKASV